MARRTLSDVGVTALKPRSARYAVADPTLRGHYVRVQPNGSKSFVAVARNPQGRQVWHTVGATDVLGIDAAREQAREAIRRVRSGMTPVETAPESFATVTGNWLKRHVDQKGLVSAPEIKRLLDRHILPAWRDLDFVSIKRSDVAALMDRVEDDHGARQADYVLNVVRSIMNWHMARNDDYVTVIARGMRRQNPKAQARTRVLSDDEIRSIWRASENEATFGAIVRFALLTAQRKSKVAGLKWTDVVDGTWTVEKGPREKDTVGSVKLPPMALAIIEAQPKLASNPYIFAGRKGEFRGFSQAKERIDGKLTDVEPWTIHDLRRTARSLMSRAGVSSEHAERTMGHVVGGVEAVYDRHRYDAEKAAVLAKLATMVDGILNQRDNVLPMTKQKKKKRTR